VSTRTRRRTRINEQKNASREYEASYRACIDLHFEEWPRLVALFYQGMPESRPKKSRVAKPAPPREFISWATPVEDRMCECCGDLLSGRRPIEPDWGGRIVSYACRNENCRRFGHCFDVYDGTIYNIVMKVQVS
jgi:hypothetical protein